MGQKYIVKLKLPGLNENVGQKLTQLQGVETLTSHDTCKDGVWEVDVHSSNSRAILHGVVEAVKFHGTRLLNMNIVKPSLEDVFIDLTGKALRD